MPVAIASGSTENLAASALVSSVTNGSGYLFISNADSLIALDINRYPDLYLMQIH